jgi:hypothetical protein
MDNQSQYYGGRARDRFEPDEADGGLVWELARSVTSALEVGRGTVVAAFAQATEGASRVVGGLMDAGDDLASYVDPGLWLEDLYALLGIASTSSVAELEERLDEMSVKVEESARSRAREELFLLQQRIAELESLIVGIGNAQTREAVGKLLGRLSELETRIDALPIPEHAPGIAARPSW